MKLKHISAVAVLTVLLPFAASAVTVDELQQQIRSLLAQVAQLQQQLKSIQTTPPVEPARPIAPTPTGRACPQILRTLNQGITGSDVKEVQAYLGVSETGYFGPATASAVAKFQATEGLSRVGSVGPQTRAAFARRCGGGGANNQSFSASPTSGAAPLGVEFTAKVAGNGGTYSIDFGDGASGSEWSIYANACMPGAACNDYQGPTPRMMTHTYTANGTYVAKLRKAQELACDVWINGVPQDCDPYKTVGTVTISVSGGQAGGEKTEELFEYVGKVAARPNELERWKVRINTNLLTDSSVKKFKINLFDGHTYDVERYEEGIQRSQCSLYQGGRGCYAWVGYISGRSCFGYDTENKKCSPAETIMFLGGTDPGIVGTIPAAVGLNNFSYSISGNADGYFIAKPDPSKFGLD